MWLHWSPRLHWSADWLAWSIKIWRTTGYLCEPKSSGRAVLGKTTLGSKIWESGGPSSPREWSAKGQKRRWLRGGQGRRGGELALLQEEVHVLVVLPVLAGLGSLTTGTGRLP